MPGAGRDTGHSQASGIIGCSQASCRAAGSRDGGTWSHSRGRHTCPSVWGLKRGRTPESIQHTHVHREACAQTYIAHTCTWSIAHRHTLATCVHGGPVHRHTLHTCAHGASRTLTYIGYINTSLPQEHTLYMIHMCVHSHTQASILHTCAHRIVVYEQACTKHQNMHICAIGQRPGTTGSDPLPDEEMDPRSSVTSVRISESTGLFVYAKWVSCL